MITEQVRIHTQLILLEYFGARRGGASGLSLFSHPRHPIAVARLPRRAPLVPIPPREAKRAQHERDYYYYYYYSTTRDYRGRELSVRLPVLDARLAARCPPLACSLSVRAGLSSGIRLHLMLFVVGLAGLVIPSGSTGCGCFALPPFWA